MRGVLRGVAYDPREEALLLHLGNGAPGPEGEDAAVKLGCPFRVRGRGGKAKEEDGAAPRGSIPRVARLMALAIHFEQLLGTGVVKDYAELARLGHVTRARITQIMNLLNLAPDIQERVLFLPRICKGRAPLTERHLRRVATIPEWARQRDLLSETLRRAGGPQ